MLRKLLETILGEGLYGKIREWRNSSRWVADSYFRYNTNRMLSDTRFGVYLISNRSLVKDILAELESI